MAGGATPAGLAMPAGTSSAQAGTEIHVSSTPAWRPARRALPGHGVPFRTGYPCSVPPATGRSHLWKSPARIPGLTFCMPCMPVSSDIVVVGPVAAGQSTYEVWGRGARSGGIWGGWCLVRCWLAGLSSQARPSRSAGILITMDTEGLLVDALAQLGVQAWQAAGVPDEGIDLVIEPGGTQVQVKHRALVTDEVARRLLVETPRLPDSVPLVVGDRVTETARRILTDHRAGYYDLRGHLALRSANVVIDAVLPPVSGRVERTHALSGSAGLEVATALLMDPAAGMAIRELGHPHPPRPVAHARPRRHDHQAPATRTRRRGEHDWVGAH